MAFENGIYVEVREDDISFEEAIKSFNIEEKIKLKRKQNKWLKIKFQYEKMMDIFDYKNFDHSKLYPKGVSCFPSGLDNLNKPLPVFDENHYYMMEEELCRRGYQEMINQQEMHYRVIDHLKNKAQERQEELKKQIEGYKKILEEHEKQKRIIQERMVR